MPHPIATEGLDRMRPTFFYLLSVKKRLERNILDHFSHSLTYETIEKVTKRSLIGTRKGSKRYQNVKKAQS